MANFISKFKLPRNPYLLFSPFLLLYIIIVLLFQANVLWGDESRYLIYAQNLTHGFYSGPDVDLYSGPGYPIILIPFVALHLPLLLIKLFNAFLYYLSTILLFKVVSRFTSFKIAALIGFFWACYFNAYENLPLILTEIFAVFLVTALMLSLVNAFKQDSSGRSNKYIYLSGALYGFIVLTKVIFGYVMLCMLVGCLIIWLFKRKNSNYKRAVTILLIALITVLPYLIYTYNLTGRVFYWSTVSGNNMYWMSSPYTNEYGNWMDASKLDSVSIHSVKADHQIQFGGNLNLKNRVTEIPGYYDSIRANHLQDFEKVYEYKTAVEQDDAFKHIAMQNIKSHPVKFIQNWFSNIGRILFNVPYSYKIQSPYGLLRLPMVGVLVLLILFCIIPTLMNWKKIPFSVRFMLFFVLIYLGGSTLGSAEIRMFTLVVPIILLWIAFILVKTIKIKFTFLDNSKK